MVKTRRLSDLYIRGIPLSVGDDSGGDPIELWVQKMNTVEHDDALRNASAVRAMYLVNKDKHDSEEWIRVRGELDEMGARDLFMELVIRDDLLMRRLRVEAELAAEEEWSKDGYLQGLQDVWKTGGMSDRYARNPEDPEAKKVFDEMKRYQEKIEEMMAGERVNLLRDWESKDNETLLNRATEEFIRRQAGSKFMEAYENWLIFFSVRNADDKERHFEDIEDVRAIDKRVRERLLTTIDVLQVDPVEGKDLAVTPPSSPSSEQPEQEATVESSGPETPSQ